MALIKCPECGREISDKAASCPHCGLPFEATQRTKGVDEQNTAQTEHLEKATETTVNRSNKKAGKKKRVLLVSLAAVVVIAIAIFLVISITQPNDPFAELYYGQSREEIISIFGEPTYIAYNDDKSVQSELFTFSFLGYETSFSALYGVGESLMSASVKYRCEPDTNTGVSKSKKEEVSKYYSAVYDYCIEAYGYADTDRRESDLTISETCVWHLEDGSAIKLFYMQMYGSTVMNGRTEISLLWAPPESAARVIPD